MVRIIFVFLLLSICACVSQKKYNLLQKEVETYKLLRQNTETNDNAKCQPTNKTTKHHKISTYPIIPQCFSVNFLVSDAYNITSNQILQTKNDTVSALHLFAYVCCDTSFFMSKPSQLNTNPLKTRYRFIHEKDTFWYGHCLWAVDSIKQHLARGADDKNLSIHGARFKYGHDVYMQCVDCSSAFKNEKGECLCSR